MARRVAPGPSRLRLLTHGRRLLADPFAALQRFVDEFGGVVHVPLGRGVFVVSEPEAIRAVLETRATAFDKGPSFDEVRALVGGGLAGTRHAEWAIERRRVAALYDPARGDPTPAIAELVARWEAKPPADLVPDLVRLAGELATGALLGAPSRELADIAVIAADALAARIGTFPKTSLDRPTAVNRKLHLAARGLADALEALGIDRDAGASFLVEAIYPVAHALAWTLLDLAQGHEPDGALFRHPPIPFILRDAVADTELDGYPIPANAIVAVVPFLAHQRGAELPFGAGPRRCPGEPLARRWLDGTVAALRERLRFAPSGPPPAAAPGVTLAPRGGLHLRIERVV